MPVSFTQERLSPRKKAANNTGITKDNLLAVWVMVTPTNKEEKAMRLKTDINKLPMSKAQGKKG
jgi:hypothetical protein